MLLGVRELEKPWWALLSELFLKDLSDFKQ